MAVNQELLNDTLQKINASLNKRFEKDADLYISRQDESDMKKHLCNGAYAAVVDMVKAKGISPDIAVKVLLRNAGIISVTDFTRFERELRPILRNADYSALDYMMEDVLANNVYIQREVRHILFGFYMRRISAEKRLQCWDSPHLDGYERDKLYGMILQGGGHGGPPETLEDKIAFMNQAFTDFPSIMNDKNAILKTANSLDEGERLRFFQHLRGEIERPFIPGEVYAFALLNAYCSYGEAAFQDAVRQIKSGSPQQYKEYIKAICQLFRQEQNPYTLEQMFDVLYKVFDSPYMKPHVRKQAARKVCPVLKAKPELYERRQAQIDQMLGGVELSGPAGYTSFDDAANDIRAGVPAKQIAFRWVNMPREAFTDSIEKSFILLDDGDIRVVKEVYSWFFKHSMGKGGTRGLEQMCSRTALPLSRFAKTGRPSVCFDLLDRFWAENVVKYKLRDKNIQDYLFEAHYDQVKQWEQ